MGVVTSNRRTALEHARSRLPCLPTNLSFVRRAIDRTEASANPAPLITPERPSSCYYLDAFAVSSVGSLSGIVVLLNVTSVPFRYLMGRASTAFRQNKISAVEGPRLSKWGRNPASTSALSSRSIVLIYGVTLSPEKCRLLLAWHFDPRAQNISCKVNKLSNFV